MAGAAVVAPSRGVLQRQGLPLFSRRITPLPSISSIPSISFIPSTSHPEQGSRGISGGEVDGRMDEMDDMDDMDAARAKCGGQLMSPCRTLQNLPRLFQELSYSRSSVRTAK